MIDDDLLRFNKKQKYLLFDTETCNLNLVSKHNVPWEYAWWVVTLDEVLEKHQHYIKWPKMRISRDAAIITGFYNKPVATEGKEPRFVLDEFEKYLYNPEYRIVAHNALGFDVYIHNIHRRLMGKATDYSYIDRVIDTNVIAKAMKLDIPINRDNLMALQYKLNGHWAKGTKTSVKALCEDFGIEYDKDRAHQAEYDIMLLHKILKKLFNKVEI